MNNYYESSEILNILQTNKINGFEFPGGTDKGSSHTYTSSYERLLKPYRFENIKLVEIGIQYGGSALLFHEYLPNAEFIFIDIVNQIHPNILNKMDNKRYSLYFDDAYSDGFVSALSKQHSDGFDILIDDGPHTLESQILCIQKYLPLIKPNGMLIVEDVQSIDNMNHLKSIIPVEIQNGVEMIDTRHIKGRWDDLLFIIHK